MGDGYKKFAKETYEQFYQTISSSLKADSSNVLVIIGEEHFDTQTELATDSRTHTRDQEPAVAAAFSHISALEASVRLVGKDKTTLSIELPQETLGRIAKEIKENKGNVPEKFIQAPFAHVLAYAIKKGIEIVPTDEKGSTSKSLDETREDAQRTAIASLARKGEQHVVVHVGGMAHLSNLAGYSNEEIIASKGNITLDPARNPFKEVFSETLLFNTTRFPPALRERLSLSKNFEVQVALAEANFAENPDNITQIDAPGQIFIPTRNNLQKIVEEAANNHAQANTSQSKTIDLLLQPANP